LDDKPSDLKILKYDQFQVTIAGSKVLMLGGCGELESAKKFRNFPGTKCAFFSYRLLNPTTPIIVENDQREKTMTAHLMKPVKFSGRPADWARFYIPKVTNTQASSTKFCVFNR
jgi:hypothetical protein